MSANGISALLDPSRVQTLLGSYQVGKSDALADLTYYFRAQEVRRRISARMVPLDGSKIRSQLKDGEYWASRKVDGEFTLVIYQDGAACTVNPGGTVRCGFPPLDELSALLAKSGVRQAILAGELYVNRTDRRPRVHDVARAARQPESAADLESLCLALFDVVELDGKPAPELYAPKYRFLEETFGNGKNVRPVETHLVRTVSEIEELFKKWVEGEGAEGLVVRSEEAGLFKIKPRHTLDVAVIGYTEGLDDRAGLIHDLLIAVMRPEGLLQILGRVGGGFTEEERRHWLSDLKDEKVPSDYAEVNDQIAYQLVRPQRVIEISCLDLLDQTTRGATIDRMVLDWDGGSYRAVRRLPLCAPISPQFIRQRDDKRVHPDDIRLKQVTDLIDVPMADRDASALVLPRSQMLRRELFTKVLKGQTMVRKLLLWKTNKELHDPDYPAYVAYVTDFSPNRAEPLKREIRVSSSATQIGELYAELSAQYVVKGWAPHG